ncbi:hypothetical protein S40293_11280 [Stachybotrys chartarum IBT 40293]|nr:hypothetical protein S40293_11280 [Stachybotrys chartarum IBT 40293]
MILAGRRGQNSSYRIPTANRDEEDNDDDARSMLSPATATVAVLLIMRRQCSQPHSHRPWPRMVARHVAPPTKQPQQQAPLWHLCRYQPISEQRWVSANTIKPGVGFTGPRHPYGTYPNVPDCARAEDVGGCMSLSWLMP